MTTSTTTPDSWPDDQYFCIDADCPNCGWAERRFFPPTAEFSCAKCDYVSLERNS